MFILPLMSLPPVGTQRKIQLRFHSNHAILTGMINNGGSMMRKTRKKEPAPGKKAPLTIAYDTSSQAIRLSVPEGCHAVLHGTDCPQIVARDLTVHPPLTGQEVLLSFQVSGPDGKQVVTRDYSIQIPGLYRTKPAHPKPTVIPELAQWHSEDSGWFRPSEKTAITVSSSAAELLASAAREFQLDYREMTGAELPIRYESAPREGDFYLSLEKEDAYLGEEGYRIESGACVRMTSSHPCGVYWATRTILQMLRQSGAPYRLPRGEIRDYPKYPLRGFMLDVGRRPFSLEILRDVIRNMAWYKMNDLQLHLNDNYIWLEDYNQSGQERDSFDAYEAMRLESSLQNEAGQSATAKDYSYSKAGFKALIEEARERFHVHIVPEIDVPAHALSFAKVFPECMVEGQTSPLQKKRPLTDHLDISRPEAVDLVKRIFDDYTRGDAPVFDAETTVHIGADEFLSDYGAYRRFVNTLVPYLKQTNPVRLWGGFTWIKDQPVTQILPEAIENVQLNLWSNSWADGMEMYEMGFQLINTIDHLLYMVPNGKGNRGSYADLLNKKRVYKLFEPRKIRLKNGKYRALPAGDPQMLGAAYALWNDNIDKKASGLTEADLFLRFFDALPLFSEKTWANGWEKGSAAAIGKLARVTAFAPRSNPLRRSPAAKGLFADYRFDGAQPQKDLSGNGRDLAEPAGADFGKGLILRGGESYAGLPLGSLEVGSFLEMELTLAEKKPGQILLECDAPYGTHDIRITASGRLGFTRESYEYEFPCDIPLNTLVTLRIETRLQKTTLAVNGGKPVPAVGKFIHNGTVRCEGLTNATLCLPAGRIGSQTNAARAVIASLRIGKLPTARKKTIFD